MTTSIQEARGEIWRDCGVPEPDVEIFLKYQTISDAAEQAFSDAIHKVHGKEDEDWDNELDHCKIFKMTRRKFPRIIMGIESNAEALVRKWRREDRDERDRQRDNIVSMMQDPVEGELLLSIVELEEMKQEKTHSLDPMREHMDLAKSIKQALRHPTVIVDEIAQTQARINAKFGGDFNITWVRQALFFLDADATLALPWDQGFDDNCEFRACVAESAGVDQRFVYHCCNFRVRTSIMKTAA